MYVVSRNNQRKDHPPLSMYSILKEDYTGDSDNWKKSFKSSIVDVMLTDMLDSLSTTVKIRGYIYDVTHRSTIETRLTDVLVGSNRIPLMDIDIVENRGNKIVIDMRFVINKSDVNVIDPGTWSFRLTTPHGFSVMTMCSPLVATNYLCALTEDPYAVATDVSPVSFTLMWPQGIGIPVIKINSKSVEIPSVSTNRIRVVSTPSTTYSCFIDNGSSKYEICLTTPSISKESYSIHYRSCKVDTSNNDNATYDLSDTDPGVIRDLRRYGVIKPGDRVLLKNHTDPLLAVGDGETISDSGSFYVIPSFDKDDGQFVCMESPEGSHIVTFDNTEEFVGYNDTKYLHGDKFVIGSRMVEVMKGSIILILHDDVPLSFPGGSTTASQVLTAGDIVLRDLIMKSSTQVTAKLSGESTYGHSSYYVYNPTDGTTLEASRIQHGLNEQGDTGSISLNVLYTPTVGNQTVHNALEVDPSMTRMNMIDSTGSLEATFDTTGLRFNSDSGDIYFGSSQEFRIHYEPSSSGDPSMLQIQGYDSTNGEYITRQLITNEPVG